MAGQAQVPLIHDMIRVSKKWLLICEDTNEPEFAERNFMHDQNGIFRTHVEWCEMWQRLGLNLVAEGRCNESGGPQQWYLLRKNKIDQMDPATPLSQRAPN